MNKKFNIELIVPTLCQEYNIEISKNMTIAESIIVINKILVNITKYNLLEKNNLYLYNKDNGEKYDLKSFIYETDIENGTSLILI